MLLLGVSKCYHNGSKCKKIRNKLFWKVFFYDDTGHFFTKRIYSIFEVIYYKLKKKAHIRVCMFCKEKYCTYEKISLLCGLCN